MGNSREEIPQWIWYNGQFLFQFDEQLKKNPKMTISSFFSDFLTNQGLQNLNIYHTKNQKRMKKLSFWDFSLTVHQTEKETAHYTKSIEEFLLLSYPFYYVVIGCYTPL